MTVVRRNMSTSGDMSTNVDTIKQKTRPDICEMVQCTLEALVKWDNCSFPGASYTEDLNQAIQELRKANVEIKYVERSEAIEDGINIFMNDGTMYQLQIVRKA